MAYAWKKLSEWSQIKGVKWEIEKNKMYAQFKLEWRLSLFEVCL